MTTISQLIRIENSTLQNTMLQYCSITDSVTSYLVGQEDSTLNVVSKCLFDSYQYIKTHTKETWVKVMYLCKVFPHV